MGQFLPFYGSLIKKLGICSMFGCWYSRDGETGCVGEGTLRNPSVMLEEQDPVREDPLRNPYVILGLSHHGYRDQVQWDKVLTGTEFQ